MNNNALHIDALKKKEVPVLTDEEAFEYANKGWSFSNIYSLKNLRDTYLIIKRDNLKSISEINNKVKEFVSYENTEWTDRRILENINALINFKLINKNYTIIKVLFENSKINSELSEKDKSDFKWIFFSYFRFKEISSWFVNIEETNLSNFSHLTEKNYVQDSIPLYYFSYKNRFPDTLLKDIASINVSYHIPNAMPHLMRFFEVYLHWGTKLGVIEKFSLSGLNIKVEGNRNISIAYFIKKFQPFDLISFIRNNVSEKRHISIPEVIFEVARNYRYSIPEIKEFLISQIISNDDITYERSSEIFIIKGKTSDKKINSATYLYPFYNDYYLSHLIIRRKYE